MAGGFSHFFCFFRWRSIKPLFLILLFISVMNKIVPTQHRLLVLYKTLCRETSWGAQRQDTYCPAGTQLLLGERGVKHLVEGLSWGHPQLMRSRRNQERVILPGGYWVTLGERRGLSWAFDMQYIWSKEGITLGGNSRGIWKITNNPYG